LSSVKNAINHSTLLDHINLGTGLFNSCYKLQYGQSSDIIIDNNFKSQAMGLINYYKGLSPNPQARAILDDIANDLNIFVNKTKSEVLAIIQ